MLYLMGKASFLHKLKHLMSQWETHLPQHQRDTKFHIPLNTGRGTTLTGPPSWDTQPANAAQSGRPSSCHSKAELPKTGNHVSDACGLSGGELVLSHGDVLAPGQLTKGSHPWLWSPTIFVVAILVSYLLPSCLNGWLDGWKKVSKEEGQARAGPRAVVLATLSAPSFPSRHLCKNPAKINCMSTSMG